MKQSLAVLVVGLGLMGCGVGADTTATVSGQDEARTASSALNTTVSHFVWNGAQAGMSGGDELSWTDVNVYLGGTSKQQTAFLNAFVQRTDPTSLVCTTETLPCPCKPGDACDGCVPETYTWCHYTRSTWDMAWGPVSPTSLRQTGNAARIDVDLAASPQVVVTHCAYDEVINTYDCAPVTATDHLTLDLRRLTHYSETTSGTQDVRYGKFTGHRNGTYSRSLAQVTGTVFGKAVSGQGTMGSGVNVSVDVLRQ